MIGLRGGIHGGLGFAEFGVHEDEGEVGEQIGDSHEDAVKEDETEDEIVVLTGDAIDEMLPHPGDLEDRFDDEGAGDDAGEGRAEKGHGGSEGGSQGVLGDDGEGFDSLGSGGADVVLREDIEHAAASESSEVGRDSEAEGDGGEDDVAGASPAGDIERRSLGREADLEDGTENEGDDADSSHRDNHRDVVDGAIMIERGDNAQGDAEAHAEDEGEEAELKRNGKGFADEIGNFTAFIGEGVAKVAVAENVFPVIEILNGERFIEAVVGFEGRLLGGRGGLV